MGYLRRLFGDHEDKKDSKSSSLPWIALTEMDQLEKISRRSFEKTQLVYKHSTTCGISSMVLNMFTKGYTHPEETVDMYFLDIHRYRSISNEIAHKHGVRHESPQLLVIKNGTVVAHGSHGGIPEMELSAFL
ncbi:MAG: bacillithiol system redox-active protein YtxJ [Flavobacteriaceae bacterium]